MKRFRADTVSFTLADDWSEVTFDQFLTITDPDAPTTTDFLLTTLSGLNDAYFRPLRVHDLDKVVGEHLAFINDFPELPTAPPATLTIGGRTIKLPDDLGAVATVGQMWDVEFVVSSRQKEGLPVDVISMAPVLLPVFLWPLLQTEPYTNRQATEDLWPEIARINCIDGLALSGFFLSSFLNPSPSGRISVETLPLVPTKRWPLNLRRVWQRLIPSMLVSN